jgi:hypothetical protein
MGGWELVLLGVWATRPMRLVAGLLGIVLLAWSVIPLARRSGPVRRQLNGSRIGLMADFFDGLAECWRQDWIRAVAGILGFGLFLWAASPLATVP